MPTNASNEALTLLRDIYIRLGSVDTLQVRIGELATKLAEIETKVEIHLGPEGTLSEIKRKLENTNSRMLFLSGGLSVTLNALKWAGSQMLQHHN